jgi:HD-like signal output (HDOD) protein
VLSDDEFGTQEVADLIASDATFSARLLQVVNSIEFGLPDPVTNIRQALTMIGWERTRWLAATVAVGAYSRAALSTAELRRCWEHTLATAVIAEAAGPCCGISAEVAYTAGLMHDIGRLGLLVAYPKEYESALRRAAERCIDLLDHEQELFGVNHAEAGRYLAARWQLPAELQIVAGRHHDPAGGCEPDLLTVVHVACRLADCLGYDVTAPLVPLSYEEVLSELPAAPREQLAGMADTLRERIALRIETFDQPVEPAQAPVEIEPVEQREGPEFHVELPCVPASAAVNGPGDVSWALAAFALAVLVMGILAFAWR